tara:strand:+ start:73797 stop:74234 length:438 start_codon:yes stop_codon:yes gene_type:complete
MELALLVYIVDLITGLDSFLTKTLGGFLVLTAGGLVVGFLVSIIEDCYTIKQMWDFLKKYYPVKTLLTALFIVWLIPSQQTMKYIGAAYLIQTTFESEFVQESITLSQKAVIKQLQTWSEDDADIKSLLNSVDIPLTKTDKSGKE